MDHIIYTTLNAFGETWPDIDTDILARRIHELLYTQNVTNLFSQIRNKKILLFLQIDVWFIVFVLNVQLPKPKKKGCSSNR